MSSKRKPHPLESLTFSAPAPAPAPAPVAPPTPEEPTRSSNVTLPVSVWEWIDQKHTEARSKGGSAFRKAAIIRAAFMVAMAADVDLSGAQSEEELVERINRAVVQAANKTAEQPHN